MVGKLTKSATDSEHPLINYFGISLKPFPEQISPQCEPRNSVLAWHGLMASFESSSRYDEPTEPSDRDATGVDTRALNEPLGLPSH